tara:strand:+ start:10621 stop:10851 length:231 start_codon:yes stop_codon:yes gene_type:complete
MVSYFVGMLVPVLEEVPPTERSMRSELVPFFLRFCCPREESFSALTPILGTSGANDAGGGGGGGVGAGFDPPKHIY